MNRWLKTFFYILNRDRIPKLPRGMLSSDYNHIAPDERRIMARIGARDPAGIQFAMKRYGVASKEELIALLEHQQPRRNVWHRLLSAFGRAAGGVDYVPHHEEVLQAARAQRRAKKNAAVIERLRETQRMMK